MNHLTLLGLNFLTCKMGIITVAASGDSRRIPGDAAYEEHSVWSDSTMSSIIVVVITIRKGRLLGSRGHLGGRVLKRHLKEMAWQASGGQGKRGWMRLGHLLFHECQRESRRLPP